MDTKNYLKNGLIFLSITLIVLISGCTNQENNEDDKIIITIHDGLGSSESYSLSDIKNMTTITGISQFQNQFGNWRDYGTYIGVKINTLLKDVGGMNTSSIIKVTATDDYFAYYTYDNVYPTGNFAAIQGDMILAYSLNGTEIPDYDSGPRIIFLPDDEAYSNNDMVDTTSLESRGAVPSGGSRWVKSVEKIEVIYDNQLINLVGSTKNVTYTLTQIKLMSLDGYGSFRNSIGTVSGPNQYTGVNMTYLLEDLEGFGTKFNLKLTASDDYSKDLTFDEIKGYFETFDENGSSLGEKKLIPTIAFESSDDNEVPPLRFAILDPVGTAESSIITSSGYWIKDIVNLEVTEYVPSNDTILMVNNVIGTSEEYNLLDLKDMSVTSGNSQFQNQIYNWMDYGNYIGVKISTILEDAGGINSSCIVNITSTDGYSTYYTYENIYPSGEFATIQGDMILAYSLNGTDFPDYDDGLRVVFLPDDEGYSNDDMVNTTSLESRGVVPSGSNRWAKYVEKIEVISDSQSITIVGSSKSVTYTFTQLKLMSIEGYGTYRNIYETVTGPNQYTGVNITFLLEDLEGFDSSFSFRITASDDYFQDLTFDECQGYFETLDASGNSLGIVKLIPVLAFESSDDDSVPPIRFVILDPEGNAVSAAITSSGYWVTDLVSFEVV